MTQRSYNPSCTSTLTHLTVSQREATQSLTRFQSIQVYATLWTGFRVGDRAFRKVPARSNFQAWVNRENLFSIHLRFFYYRS